MHVLYLVYVYVLYCTVNVTVLNESVWALADAFELMFLWYAHMEVSRQNPFGECNNQKDFINILWRKLFIFLLCVHFFLLSFSLSLFVALNWVRWAFASFLSVYQFIHG